MTEQTASLRIEVKHIISDVQDLVVLEHLGEDRYVYAAKPSLDVMRQFYEQSILNPNDTNVDAFNGYWKFDEKKGIRGSNTFLALRFDKQALRPNGLWVPGLLEAKALESQGKLQNGVYRDYGLVVYNNDNPDKQLAEILVSQTKQLGLGLPLIVSFRALDYFQNKDKKYGIELSLLNSGKGIISGKEATEKINSLDYKSNSGVQRLYRYRYGNWGAGWGGLGYSDDFGRVGWICGEETEQNLNRAYELLTEREYANNIRKLEREKWEKQTEFRISLKH